MNAIGTVLRRPTGSEAIAWILYANALDKIARMKRETRKRSKQPRK
jgi:hypothetical protein